MTQTFHMAGSSPISPGSGELGPPFRDSCVMNRPIEGLGWTETLVQGGFHYIIHIISFSLDLGLLSLGQRAGLGLVGCGGRPRPR